MMMRWHCAKLIAMQTKLLVMEKDVYVSGNWNGAKVTLQKLLEKQAICPYLRIYIVHSSDPIRGSAQVAQEQYH